MPNPLKITIFLIAQLDHIKVTALKRLENQLLHTLTVAGVTLKSEEQITSAFSLHKEGCSMQTGLNQLLEDRSTFVLML